MKKTSIAILTATLLTACSTDLTEEVTNYNNAAKNALLQVTTRGTGDADAATVAGFTVERQVPVPVFYKGERLTNDLRLDIIVDGKVILELKSVTEYRKLFEKQLYTYLRLAGCELGYVINFNEENLRDGIHTVRNPYACPAD